MNCDQGFDVDAGGRDVGADPVDQDREEREEELALQLLVHAQAGTLGAVTYASTFPPAASILARADAESASPRTE